MSSGAQTADAVAAALRIERRVGAHAGLKPPAWVLASRVRDRMRELGLDATDAYADLIESSAGRRELELLTECLRVGETRFFRHKAHVAAMLRVVIPDLVSRLAGGAPPRRVRAWSAGCASGEEPYTLAMLLDEGLPEARGWRIDVLGTDLSEEALAVARLGVYPASALDAVPAQLRDRSFTRDGARVRIAPRLAHHVRFARRNLLDPVFPRQVDVIFCRNVLIYFEPEARVRTIERLIAALSPGGYLFLGYAESLRDFAPSGALEALRTEDGVIYRRPFTPRSPAPPAPRPAVTVSLAGVHDDATAVSAQIKDAMAGARAVIIDLDGAEFLADDVAEVLHRASANARATGIKISLRATRPGPRRWLARHGLAGEGDEA